MTTRRRTGLLVAALAVGVADASAEGSFNMTTPRNLSEFEMKLAPGDAAIADIDASKNAAEEVFMRYATPVVVVSQAGDTYETIIRRHCPGVSDAYIANVEALLPLLNGTAGSAATLATPVPELTAVQIPYCIGSQQIEHTIQSGQYPWQLYQLQKDQAGGVGDWQEFLDRYNQLNGADAADKTLSIGEKVLLPSSTVSVSIPTGSVEAVQEELKNKPGLNPGFVGGVVVKKEIQWGELQSDTPDCTETGVAAAKAFSEKHFMSVASTFAYNMTLVDNTDLKREPPRRPVIALFDGGLEDMRSSYASSGRTMLVDGAQNMVEIMALPNDVKKSHGSGVMSVALGGHFYANISPLLGLIGVAPYRIVDNVCGPAEQGDKCFPVSSTRLDKAMWLADQSNSGVDVVNLSIAFSREEQRFNDYLAPDKAFIVVAAAGNDGVELKDANKRYPAMSGGDEGSHIIVVAATSGDDQLTRDSNYSSKYVDIAAWGCAVPVMEYDARARNYAVNLRSGTSYAAPQVSFVAALLSGERHKGGRTLKPAAIKKRILFSADIDGKLWSEVKHGRRLNLAKALSVYTDVVEVDGALLRGRVSAPDFQNTNVILCSNVAKPLGSLRKIARLDANPLPDGVKRYLIYVEEDGRVEAEMCDSIVAKFMLEDPLTKSRTDLDMTKVKDIVFASQPYWQYGAGN